jgi:hypothetical protein
MDIQQLRYPIGKFNPPANISDIQLRNYIDDIRYLPAQLELAIQNLDQHQLETPYRPDGWTVNQVVHHVADSHMNAYIRVKLALTEDNPIIKPYEEHLWAELPDVANTPINFSITLLHAMHTRWVNMLDRLTEDQWVRTFQHPANKVVLNLKVATGLYSWHGKHHLAHIENLKERNNW